MLLLQIPEPIKHSGAVPVVVGCVVVGCSGFSGL